LRTLPQMAPASQKSNTRGVLQSPKLCFIGLMVAGTPGRMVVSTYRYGSSVESAATSMLVMRSGNFLEALNKEGISAGIVIFNLICITLSILSSKVGMRKFSSRIILSVFTVFITIFSAAEGLAENKLEEAKKIELLLAGIGTMENVVFIRNGKEYSANKGGGL